MLGLLLSNHVITSVVIEVIQWWSQRNCLSNIKCIYLKMLRKYCWSIFVQLKIIKLFAVNITDMQFVHKQQYTYSVLTKEKRFQA